jgi:hypothetical protein
LVLEAGTRESKARESETGFRRFFIPEPHDGREIMATTGTRGGRRYGKAAGTSVESAMKRRNRGTLHSGSEHGPKVKSRKQAIAIGLSEARAKGAKVPRKKSS